MTLTRDQLYARYPVQFPQHQLGANVRFRRGIECGEGWLGILDHLCAALQPSWTFSFDATADGYLNEDGHPFWSPEPPTVIVDCLKEKMGTLRVHKHLQFDLAEEHHAKLPKTLQVAYERYGRFYDGIAHMAECMSERTCEVTGKPGELCVRGGWLKTLAPDEAAKQGYRPYAEVKREEADAS